MTKTLPILAAPILAAPILAALILLPACQQVAPRAVAQRIELDAARRGPAALPSPDTKDAAWMADGERAIHFGKSGAAPILTIRCDSGTSGPAIRVIRHAPADPGAKALFALLGNRGMARIPSESRPATHGWQWESLLPAGDPALDVLADAGAIEATMPGAGTVNLPSSGLRSDLVARCRALAQA